jgi:hypothetical protein
MDYFTKSDPICYVYITQNKHSPYSLVGKTECISNNLNPDFAKSFIVNYYFEKEQYMKFEVFD